MPPSRTPSQHVQSQQPHSQTPYHIAWGVTEALRNPYAHSAMNQFHNPYSAHYANAYMQAQQAVHTTPEGYTLSSTYDPRTNASYAPIPNGSGHQASSSSRGRGPKPQTSNTPRQSSGNGSWYQPGNLRCTYSGCSFSGSKKSVEIHMMDRHLIYPPGWAKKNKGSDWDADPSLKGKTVPIQGTSIVLNTPEALDLWLAERRKRWPTAQRVEEKKVKMEEAIARGQLPLMGSSSRGTKRQRDEGQRGQGSNRGRHKAFSGQKKQKTFSRDMPKPQADIPKIPSEPSISTVDLVSHNSPDENTSDDDEAPEVVSSKQPTNHVAHDSSSDAEEPTEMHLPDVPPATSKGLTRPKRKEPKLPPRNPFASRPTLLRNLLAPEIRMTVSNLSQAIRFLVDNDFLREVELKPGQATDNLIQVLDSKAHEQTQELHQTA
ncbi:hypothetical protein NP233_g5474 [Leucocoprinus birnbaumii]|uniref:FMR1-interacting protein 1 conserved domain-containing protein n=1 Tax=Leucocoprinus birnbaumii TaxID=56174 RepID=A0AAD5YQX2_9AGAR|nr:hypothetical protein NP233_g5474 [Leucocoprinus birnbaumii]